MEFGWDTLWFIVGVSLLVTVHEFGHFWVARKLGFKVLRFSVGFGKPLFKRIGAAPDHTEYVIASVPLGGYVRMLDERDGVVPPEDLPRAFASKPPWKRILVMLAGPAANFLFAILILWGMLWFKGDVRVKPVIERVTVNSPAQRAGLRAGDQILSIDGERIEDQGEAMLGLLDAVSDDGTAIIRVDGSDRSERTVNLSIADPAQRHKLTEPFQLEKGLGIDFWSPTIPPVLAGVIAGGPAAEAGLRPGDRVIAVDGKPMHSFQEFASYVRPRPGQEILLTVQRDGSDFSRRVRTASDTENGETIGRLQIQGPGPEDIESYIPETMKVRSDSGPVAALGAAVARSWQMTVAQAKFFARMLSGKVSTKNISGFISIADYAGDAARAGTTSFLMLLVLLSLSLGFLNLLPIPILDGGQIMFQLVEWAKGGPLSDRTYMVGQQAGLLLLVLLMGVAVFNDLSRIFAAHT
ncbi:MAG TPA: RIP metalloprotease RseP [Steroidobacteraceae bacterium]|nr:RIP metalloprotease RseP [Steroidobacteraceae bacterium]